MTLLSDPEGTEPKYLNKLLDLAGCNVLEIGCGDGRLTQHYARSTQFLVGMDLKHTSLLEARQACPPDLMTRVTFALTDAQHLPFPSNSFDVALLAWSL